MLGGKATGARASGLVLCFLLASCGGGGGGTSSTPPPAPTPVPTPSPTAVANDDLIAPLASETFRNIATTGSSNYSSTTGGFIGNSSGPATLTLSYNAGASSYSVSTTGRSQTFGPGDIDSAQSSAQLTVYAKTGTTSSETLTITKAATTGRFTYRYVGSGFWERIAQSPSTITGSFDAFAFGVEAANSAVPVSGTGRFDIDLVGARSMPNEIAAYAGLGYFDVDFSRGVFALRGTFGGLQSTSVEFTAEGSLASGTNGFSGAIRFTDGNDIFGGQLNGRFYGPALEEVGGAWWAVTPLPNGFPAGSNQVAAGTIMGRKGTPLAPQTSFANVTDSAFHTAAGRRTSATGATAEIAQIHYDPANDRYSLILPDLSATFPVFNRSSPGGQTVTGGGQGLTVYRGADLIYVRGADWLRQTSSSMNVDSLLYGYPTAASALPRTGKAGYALTLHGTQWGLTTQPTYSGNNGLHGSGGLIADLAAGTFTLSGSASITQQTSTNAYVGGGFTGSGTLSSTGNSLSGTIKFGIDNVGDYNGDFTGTFFGPAAEEIGLTFSASGVGGTMSGSLLGKKDAAILSGSTPIRDYVLKTTFDGYSAMQHVPSSMGSTALVQSSGGLVPLSLGVPTLTWDPAAGTYQVKLDFDVPDPRFDITLSALDRNSAASNADFDVYSKTSGTTALTGRVYRNDTGTLKLTYTSFFELVQHQPSLNPGGLYDHDDYSFIPFGSRSPNSSIPRTGTARYDGVLFGDGYVVADLVRTHYDLTGTSRFDFNFSGGLASGTLTVTGRDGVANTNRDFGSFTFSGMPPSTNLFNLSLNDIDTRVDRNLQAWISGQFNGPDAGELAAVFNIDNRKMAERIILTGVAIAKKTN